MVNKLINLYTILVLIALVVSVINLVSVNNLPTYILLNKIALEVIVSVIIGLIPVIIRGFI